MNDREERERKLAALADSGDVETAWAIRGMLDAIDRLLDRRAGEPLWTVDVMREGMTQAGEYVADWSRGHGTATAVFQGGGTGPLLLALRGVVQAFIADSSESTEATRAGLRAAVMAAHEASL